MSILIEGMEMPTRCGECKAFVCYRQWAGDVGDCFCGITKNDAKAKEKNADCPLVPVPPHGRLGDLDEFAKVVLNWITTQEKAYPNEDSNALSWRLGARAMGHQIYRDIEAAPTILPAEEGET